MKLPYLLPQTSPSLILPYPFSTKRQAIATCILSALTAVFFCTASPSFASNTVHVGRVLPDNNETTAHDKAIEQTKIINDAISTTKQTTTVKLSNSQNYAQVSMGGTIDGVNSYTRKRKIDPI